MSVDLIPEDDLRAALRPHHVDRGTFEAAVRERLQIAERERADNPFADLSPLSRAAAALMPGQFLAGGQANAAALQAAPVGFGYKLLSYLAFPAICLFLLMGSTFFTMSKIRRIHGSNPEESDGPPGDLKGLTQWFSDRKSRMWLVFAGLNVLAAMGSTSLMFFLYIISLGLLLHILSNFSKLRLANNMMISQSCGMGLGMLGGLAMFTGMGDSEIHLIDQMLVAIVFFVGEAMLMPIGSLQLAGSWPIDLPPSTIPRTPDEEQPSGWLIKTPRWVFVVLLVQMLAAIVVWCADPLLSSPRMVIVVIVSELVLLTWANSLHKTDWRSIAPILQWIFAGPHLAVVLPGLTLWAYECLVPVATVEIKRHVESFDDAPFYNSDWQDWEVSARWAIDANLDLDLSRPRQLLAQELRGKQDPYVLGVAFRMGLVEAEQLDQLREYQPMRKHVLQDLADFYAKEPILSLEQMDWVIRAAVLKNDLSSDERDFLQKRLNLTLESMSSNTFAVLRDARIATELLDAIGRPVDPARYRSRVHDWLRKLHRKWGGGFHPGGGYASYVRSQENWGYWRPQFGDLGSTANAVQLMAIYGIPDDLDTDWIRSYLRTKAFRPMEERWMAPVTLDRLNHLPGIKPTRWWKILYYERSLLAAMVLVAMCLYATLSAPNPTPEELDQVRKLRTQGKAT